MIREITDIQPYIAFTEKFICDSCFSDPNLIGDGGVLNFADNSDKRCFGVFRDDELIGLFVFLILPEEKYMELLNGLSEEAGAYDELFVYLEENYPGYQADFIINPGNYLFRKRLEARNAEFNTEQQRMIYTHQLPETDTDAVQVLSEPYAEQYCAMHGKDMYWTAEKVMERPDRFRTLIALDHDTVAGYIDVTCCYDENEPYDLLVREDYRRKGYGRQLLAEALKQNEPNGMILLVDVDNIPALRLYESMGFVKAEGQNNLTVHLLLRHPASPE
ncbi:MAG: GNAT family N-acetyltransferase [Solobacterium sp.]|nr:GNAT family N-acetyltransferase [Solobacterium sp.]